MTERTWTAAEIAAELRLPPLTPQQEAVIQAPVGLPALVVAGAGSGKTETMAGRVLWLLANRHVRPAEVLGLTFTRKAAGELAVRMNERIAQLVRAGVIDDHDDLDPPQIATYNSYANRLYRDNASAIGREGDGAVLGEAAAWQLARTTVTRSGDPRLLEQDRSLDQLTEAVLAISRAIADNIADPEQIRALAGDFAGILDLPLGSRYTYDWVGELVETVGQLDLLVDLALEYGAAKRRRGFVEYSDQVTLALEILRAKPALIDEQRAEHRIVLLDEYQDTSVTQAWLLSELFAGHSVMAVGDPNQSIYGWRGASAGNLAAFPRQFGGPSAGADARYSLSMSWRNGRRVLDVANRLVEPFRAGAAVEVEKLVARPDAGAEPVGVSFRQSVKDEAETVARWLDEQLSAPGGPHSAALLMRARKNQPVFLAALRERGVRYHVLGVGGLLAEPEVADVVSTLSVVHSVDAGMELLRLLAGSRWRLGAADLHELGQLSSVLKSRGIDQRTLPDEVRDRLRNSLADGERGSIVDALDFLATARDERSEWERFSPAGRERLRDAGQVFARLRSLAGLDLPDFVSAVVHELRLDIEVAANPYRTLGPAPIEALFDALTGYLSVDDVATPGGFLAWLREAEKREDLSPRPEDPEPGTVQVLTIHGAKGLEWDIVAVPRLVDGELPAGTQGARGWLRFGQLPWEFRGDAADLPRMPWRAATTRKEFVDELKAFEERVKAHDAAEERRLAYVAVTRARRNLLLSGAYWSHVKNPRPPSPFLHELAEVGLAPPIPDQPEDPVNPLGDQVDMVRWPFDPLGSRRPAVERAAAAVAAATPSLAGAWEHELEVLLAERDARLRGGAELELPSRVPASRFKDYLDDPAAVASALRRPMPERPFRATQLGTIFHAWVEGRSLDVPAADELDTLEVESDGEFVGVDAELLAALKATFEASPWAGRRPVEVEREIHLPFDGRIVICKIDAIYQEGEGDEATFEVVDWKTGKAPSGAADLQSKQLQLALYRLAYAKWAGIDPSRITAAFFFVADDLVIRPEHIDDEAGLLARWRAVFGDSLPA